MSGMAASALLAGYYDEFETDSSFSSINQSLKTMDTFTSHTVDALAFMTCNHLPVKRMGPPYNCFGHYQQQPTSFQTQYYQGGHSIAPPSSPIRSASNIFPNMKPAITVVPSQNQHLQTGLDTFELISIIASIKSQAYIKAISLAEKNSLHQYHHQTQPQATSSANNSLIE
ncbi:hypothetical protein MJO28_016948 [Puccinia striiformis f. sp. tritici]|nr:hypothetical protein MJO28_016948 [Puccinia striiformis f. sp. tritici]